MLAHHGWGLVKGFHTRTNRQEEVAQAALRLIERNGPEQASLRAIAHELGCSIGVLTHHFANKEELLLFALGSLVGRLFRDALDAGGELTGMERLEAILLSALPTNARRRERWRQWVAFLGQITSRKRLLMQERQGNQEFLEGLQNELRELSKTHLIDDEDVEFEARAIMSLVDGVAVDAVLHPNLYTQAVQERIIKRHLQHFQPRKHRVKAPAP
jgi:AcrR family transcriptional regulator